MARLGGQITLLYHIFVAFTFFATPFFANIAAPVVFVSAREVHREQALARAQRRWNQRISHSENSDTDPDLALLRGPSDPHEPWPLPPTPTSRESHRFAAPFQTSVPSRTKSVPVNRITSSPEVYGDLSPLHRRYIEKRAVCPFDIQTTVYLFFASGAQMPYSTSTVAGPRSTGIPGDTLSGLSTLRVDARPTASETSSTSNGGGSINSNERNENNGSGGHGPNTTLLAGIFSILALITVAFAFTAWHYYRNRRARRLAAAGHIEERKDTPTVVREMGSKGFAALDSSPPPSRNRAFLQPETMVDKALSSWGRPRDQQVSMYSEASDDSEIPERPRRSVRWNELPPGSMRLESDFTGARSDEMYSTIARDCMDTTHVEEFSPIPASPSLDFQFPNQHTNTLIGSEHSHSPPATSTSFNIPRVPVRCETNIVCATIPDVLYETGPSRSESSASSYAVPPTGALLIGGRPISQQRSNLTGATSASRSISLRRATTTTAATSISPTFFKRTSDIQQSPPRPVSPPLLDLREGASNPRFGLAPASQLEARTVGGARQVVGTSGAGEDLFATSGHGAGTSSNTILGPSESSIPFPRESVQILPVPRTHRREEMMSPERQVREKERKLISKRIVELAMASPGALVSEESFSTDSQGVLDPHEGIGSKPLGASTNEGSHPPISVRQEHFRHDSLAATTETRHTRFSTKSYPYAGLIALHAPTARPLSASSKGKSPISLGHLSLNAETDYGIPFGGQSRAASFSSSQYLYGYPNTNLECESAVGRSVRSSRRSSMSALSAASPVRQRNPSIGPSGRTGARASFGPTNKAEAAQRAAALIQLTSGVRRDRQAPT